MSIIKNFMNRDGLVQGFTKFSGRRLKAMLDSAATTVVLCICALAYLTLSGSDSAPVEFQEAIGEIVSIEATGSNGIPTITLSNETGTEGEVTETCYKRSANAWVIPHETGVVKTASNVNKALENVWSSHEMGIEVEGTVTAGTWTPRVK